MITWRDGKNKLLFKLWKFGLKIMSERKNVYFIKSELFSIKSPNNGSYHSRSF